VVSQPVTGIIRGPMHHEGAKSTSLRVWSGNRDAQTDLRISGLLAGPAGQLQSRATPKRDSRLL